MDNPAKKTAVTVDETKIEEKLEKQMPLRVNRKYEDTLFTSLFKEKDYAALLYNSLFPQENIREEDIKVLEMKKVFTVDIYNDVCLLAKNKMLLLTEHQSTLNYNMPLRVFLYIAEEYKRIVFGGGDSRWIYQTALRKIPFPEVYVVYTGKSESPPEMRLSDAFDTAGFAIGPKECPLELVVKVIGRGNAKGVLSEFISFSDEVRELTKKYGDRQKAIIEVVNKYKCPVYLLSRFMKERGDVVDLINESITFEDILELRREEGRKEGREEGRAEGIIKSGRRHLFSDTVIISDIMEEIGCDLEHAKNFLKEYDRVNALKV